jgi:hypothetical protein
MGFERIPQTDIEYGLIAFDADGKERREGATLMSQQLIEKAKRDAVTNVFFFCHGWKGDLPAARDQYNRWIGAFARAPERQSASTVFPNFTPLFIGLHWPSQPWGDEELGSGAFGTPEVAVSPDALLRSYLDRLGDRPEIRRPLEIIINEARANTAPEELSPQVRQAYLDLNQALGLGSTGVAGPPDADREAFDPEAAFEAANEAGAAFGGLNLGSLLEPLRGLSYWTMKKRGRSVGEGGMHAFLKDLQNASSARIHLMGHSFGTIVVSGMLAGPNAKGPLVRPVDSVALVQGAVSLWSYANTIPFGGGGAGYFNPVFGDRKVSGPMIVTRSKHDSAVGVFYPLASQVKGSASFDPQSLPEFGAIGAFGIQGIADGMRNELPMLAADGSYSLEKGKIYNLESSQFIAKKEGPSGAHSDIAGPEVAHAIWAAALASA